MNEELFKGFAKGNKINKDITPGNAVMYNRVPQKNKRKTKVLMYNLKLVKNMQNDII